MPGRWAEVREPTTRELAATLVLRLPLAEASVKLRAAGAEGEPDDGESREVVGRRAAAGARSPAQPEPDPDVPAGVPVPASLDRARPDGTSAPDADRSARRAASRLSAP